MIKLKISFEPKEDVPSLLALILFIALTIFYHTNETMTDVEFALGFITLFLYFA